MWCFLVYFDGLRLTSSANVCFFLFFSRFLDFVVCMFLKAEADNISENSVVCMFLNAAQAEKILENFVFCMILSAQADNILENSA